jgi:hypothetical protein
MGYFSARFKLSHPTLQIKMHSHHVVRIAVRVLPVLLFALAGLRVWSAQLVWTNTAGGTWNVAANWNPNLVPTAADTAVITNAGTYTVTNSAAVTVSSIVLGLDPDTNAPAVFPQLRHTAGTLTVTNLSIATNAFVTMSSPLTVANSLAGAGRIDQTASTLLILNTGAINTYNLSGGEQRSGTLTVTNFNWTAGDLNSDGAGQKVIIPSGGVLNFLGATDRYLSYYALPARGLDNNGTWNWIGSGNLRGQAGTVVNNYGTVIVTTNAQYNWGGSGGNGPTWNNFGSFTKTGGTNFFSFNQTALNNAGAITINSGSLAIQSTTYTGAGSVSVFGPQFQFSASTSTNNGAFTVGAGTLFTVDNGGTLGFGPLSSLTVPGTNNLRFNSGTTTLNTTNVVAPSFWLAGGTLVQTAQNSVPVVNQSAGTWQLTVPSFLAAYNLTNGSLRGGTVTVTNFNWTDGALYADVNGDKLIIPTNGVFNLLGAGEKSLFYFAPATQGYGIDNYGTWNWSVACILRGFGSTVNNYGTVTLTAPTLTYYSYYSLSYPAPRWNNYGTFTKATGAGAFSFNGAIVNNLGSLDIQSGTLTFDSSSKFTNSAAINVSASALLLNDGGSESTWGANGVITAPTANSLRIPSGAVYLQTANLTTPALWINGGTLYQQVPNGVSNINQSAGTWWLSLTTGVNTYNLTNGTLRGGTLTVTNFAWTDGGLYANTNGDKLIIPTNGVFNLLGAGEKSLFYFAPATQGYGIDNYGTWNWSGACILRGFGSTVNNYGTVLLTAPTLTYYSYYSVAYPAPRWNNYGTFTKSTGTGAFSFNGAIVNNLGTLNVQAGSCNFESSTKFTNSAAINVSAAAVLLNDSSSESTWLAGSTITAPGANSLRIPSGAVYLQTTNLTTPALWINGGTLYQQVPNVVSNINQSAGTWWLSLTTGVNTYNLTNGTLRGGTLTVTNFAWTDGGLYANTNGDKLIIPTNGVFNLLGAGEKSLFYFAPATQGYGIDNLGTWNWSGSCILRGFGSVVNNVGTVNHTATGTAYYSYYSVAYPTPTWNNFGTFTKSSGGGTFYFSGCYLNSSGTIGASAGTLSIYGSTFANFGYLNGNGSLLQFYGATGTNAGSITVGAGTPMTVDGGSVITFGAAGSFTGPSVNSLQLISGSLAVEGLNLYTPSIWINGGTLLQRTNIVVSTINESGGALQLEVPCFLNTLNQTNGGVQGRNLTVTNWLWVDGYHYRGTPGINTNDDRTIIPSGGTLTFPGTAARYLSYYSGSGPSRTLDNYGTINWTGASILYSYGLLNNYGTVNVSGTGTSQYAAAVGNQPPTWNNYGTFTRSTGSLFYFNTAYLNNTGTMDILNGTLSIYASTFTNVTGVVNLAANAFFQSEQSAAVVFNAPSRITAPTVDSIRLGGASAVIETTNIVSPSLWLQAGTLYQRTNIVVSTINESGGFFELAQPAFLNQLNQTNGYVQGRNLTVTNWLWVDGYHYRGTPGINTNDDRTIIPPGGTLTFPGTAARYLTYYSGSGPSRTLDNYGTINWTGASILYSYGTLNNYGAVNVAGTGTSQYAAAAGNQPPTWNNYGTFTRTNGSIFYFSTSYLNNLGLLDIQSGTLSIYASTFTNLASGNILVRPGAVLANDNGSGSTYEPGSSVAVASTNAFQVNSGTVTLRTPAVTAPSLWINGGTLNQNTNNAVTTINESAGIWRLNVPVSLATYNLTNGELRGANLAVDTFNWFGGNLNSDGPNSNLVTVATALNIVSATAKSMSYYTAPGRSVINNGNAIWGGGNITFSGQSSFVNNGNWNVTNDVSLGWTLTGGTPPLFQNNGTFTKSAGAGILTLGSTTFTNNGTVAINSGGFAVGGPFVQTSGSAWLGTNFSASSSVSIQTGPLTGKGSIAGAFYNNGSVNPGASPGFINGNTFTNTAAGIYNVEIAGNTGAGTNYDQMRFSGPVTLDGTLNVSLFNNYALILSNRFTVLTTSARSGTFATVIPPPGVGFNTIYSTTNVVLEVATLTNAPLQILTNPVSQTIWTPDPVTFSAFVSGVTPITFQWQFNGTNISGATNNTYSLASVATTNAGLYTLQIVDGYGGTTNTSATLTVIPFTGTIWWTNTLGGNWSVPANWLPNRIPNITNQVVIVSNGTYTVTVDVPAALSNLTVGAIGATGSPTVHVVSGQSLTVGGSTSWETNSTLALNGLFQMNNNGSNSVRGRLDWQLGTLSGAGRTVIATNATLTFLGSLNQKFIATNILENYGTFTYGNDSFGNAQGLRFSGGANLTNYPSGVISIGTAAYDYSGSQSPRSYFVNYGTINANSANVFSPVYLSIDFINYGTLQDNGYVYISRGTNYGTFSYGNTLCEVSVFGDEATGEYFSFENGTALVGAYPLIAVGGYAQWNSTSVHPGRVTVLSGSGGASFANPEFRILKNYTQSGQTLVYKGRWTQANPALTADLNDFSDGLVNNFHSFVITNAGTLRANTFSHGVRNLANSGSIIVRSNLTLAGSSYTYGGGSITITNGASATFSGGTVEAQTVLNRGTNSVTGGLAFIGGTAYRNFAGARTYFAGGSFVTGPASLLNEGLLDGFGGLALTAVTNRATVLANDSLGRSLALGVYRQESGVTELSPGQVSGNLDIIGGLLVGTNAITGTVRNAATINPGKPFGLLSVTGNFTNAPGATYFLPINGARAITNFPQTQIGGTSFLAGTLYVNFTNGFTPAPGNLFTAMVFTARSGTFDAVVNDTYGLEAFYSGTNLILRAENLLPNVTLSVQGGNNQLVCQTFRINASATDPDGVVTNLIVRLDGAPVASSTGAAIKTSADSDFPTTFTLVAQATDDRSGVRSVTNLVTIFNYSQTNVLFLGGVRTNDFKLCLVGEPGRNYEVYGITNLTTTNWVDLGTMTQANGTWRYLDQRTITNRAYRFYRTQQLP